MTPVTIIVRSDGGYCIRSRSRSWSGRILDDRGTPIDVAAIKAQAVRIWAEIRGRNRLRLVK